MAENEIELNNHGSTTDAIRQASTPLPLPSSGSQPTRNGLESSGSQQTTSSRSISESSTGSQPATKKNPSDFIFGKSIGEGSFSTVYLAKDADTHREYAIKVCNKRHIIRENKSKYVKQERDILQRLSGSPFIVKLFCTFQCTERLYFVLTLARNGELHTLIQKMGKLDFNLARFFTCQLLQALEAMKRHKILHRDLKPENILLDENMNILVTDFGSAKFMDGEEALINNEVYKQMNNPGDHLSSSSDDEKHEPTQNGDADDSDELDAYILEDSDDDSPRPFLGRLRSFVGTANFLSPEIVKFKNLPVTYACDLWAFACVIYQMLTGKLLFAGTNDFIIFKRIINLKYKIPDDFPDSAKDLIKRILVIHPCKRLGARDGDQYYSIRNHRFFDGVDWTCLGSAPIDKTVAKSSTIKDDGCFKCAQPGFDERQLARLLGLLDNKEVIELPVVHLPRTPPLTPPRRNIADVPEMERESRLEEQRNNQVINDIVDGHLILKQGILEKKHNTISISRKKLFFITLGPKIFYTDPETFTKKKEIVWTKELKVESRNFKQFLIHTPQRVYRLECPASTAPEWKEVIEEVHTFYFPPKQEEPSHPGSQ